MSLASVRPLLMVSVKSAFRGSAALLCVGVSLLFAVSECKSAPSTTYWDGAHLASVRASHSQKNSPYKETLKRLQKEADRAVKRGPYSVTDKQETAPSGDKHDYLSYARYWWPNPKTANGLPYVRRDGRTNQEQMRKGDRETIGKLYDDVETLAIAGYVLDEPKYSAHAARLLRAWFLDPASRMNPHMRYGQAVPGLNSGRGSGILDTRHFIRVLDSVALLRDSDSWSDDEQTRLVAWMKEYLEWLRTDPQGKDESNGSNNHGTWYDAQVAAIAMFVGEREVARRIVEAAKTKRIAACIEPDGRQPEELERTKSLHYSVFNLSAMAMLARIGEQMGVDLWNFKTHDGRSIRRGLDFVMPYVVGEKKWPYEQINGMSVSPADMGLFYLAAARYHDPRYLRALDGDRQNRDDSDYVKLLFPGR